MTAEVTLAVSACTPSEPDQPLSRGPRGTAAQRGPAAQCANSLLVVCLLAGLRSGANSQGLHGISSAQQALAETAEESHRSLLAADSEAAQAAEVAAITARLALLELKTLVLEDPLNLLDNWQPETPTCRFKRVRCDKAGRVVNITLTSPDHLLSQYADLQALQHGGQGRLSFVNDIDPDNPADWEAVTKFKKHWPDWHYQTPQLSLSQLPASENFLQLGRDSLRGLHLDNTRLQNSILPDSWSAMTSLTHISLSACGLAGAVPESWASLQALEYVNLGDNPDLEGPLPATWGQLPRLQYLDLSLLGVVRRPTVMLGTLPPEWGSLGGLHGLDLCRTSLTGTLPWEWGLGLRNLTALSLGETALSGTLPASWAGLSNLSFFLAEATQLWGQVPAAWAEMPSLKMVNLEGSSVRSRLHWSWSQKCEDPSSVIILPGSKVGQNACEAFRKGFVGRLLHHSSREALGVLLLGFAATGVAFWCRPRRALPRLPSRSSSPKML